MRISDWSSDVCSSDLGQVGSAGQVFGARARSLGVGRKFGRQRFCNSVGWFPASAWRSRPVIFLGKRKGASFRAPLFYVRTTFAIGFRQSEQCARFIGFRFTLSHRSEEHTSELQSLMRISYAVFCLKKK